MKKIAFWFVIILLLSGVVFFFGWTQYKLDKDTYGVIHTKTSGYNEKPIKSGEFSWTFLALIPKNLTITQIPSNNRIISVSVEDELPSAELYRIMAVGDPDFSYKLHIDIPYAIKEDACVKLVSEYGLNEHNSAGWFMETDEKVRQTAHELLVDLFSDNVSMYEDKKLLSSTISSYLQKELSNYFAELSFGEIMTSFSRLPDYNLYLKTKSDYQDLIELKNKTLANAINNAPEKVANDLLYIDKLESYGKLLSQYPVLLEYLQIESGRTNK